MDKLDKSVIPFKLDLTGMNIDQIRDAKIAAMRAQKEALDAMFGKFAESLQKVEDREREALKIAQLKSQAEAKQFYADERVLKVQVCKVTEKGLEIEAEGVIPLQSPSTTHEPVLRMPNKDGKPMPVRGKHLELRNGNASITWKDSGKVANFNLTMKIGTAELVEYRVPSTKKPEEGNAETFSKRADKDAAKQAKADIAAKLQETVSK